MRKERDGTGSEKRSGLGSLPLRNGFRQKEELAEGQSILYPL